MGYIIENNYKFYRIALRAIGRATDKRTLIATLLPKYTATANSLQVQRNSENMNDKEKLFILGMLNSYVLDFILRQQITVNINQIYLKQLPIPNIKDVSDADQIVQIVKELLKENNGYYSDLDKTVVGNSYSEKNHDELIAELNARVMINFDLTRQEIVTLMQTFESPKYVKDVQKETQRILDCYDKLSEEN